MSYNGTSYTYYFVVSKSTDAGASWQRDTLISSTNYIYCHALAVHPVNRNIVYAGAYNGLLYKSTDAGNTWTLSNNGLTNAYYIYDIAVNPTDLNIVYIGSSNAAYKSTNGGANWFSIGLSSVNDVLVHPLGPDTIYAGTSNGFYKSTNGGTSWNALNDGLIDLNITCIGIKTAGGVGDSAYLYAGTRGGGLHRRFLSLVPVEEHNSTEGMARGFNLIIFPNPASERVVFSYYLENPAHVRINLYDIQGRIIKTVIDSRVCAGYHTKEWINDCLPTGVYFARIIAEDNQQIQKLIVVK